MSWTIRFYNTIRRKVFCPRYLRFVFRQNTIDHYVSKYRVMIPIMKRKIDSTVILKPRYVTLAGLMAWFGFEKKEEDPLIETLKRAILSITREEFDKAEQILHLSLKIAQERMDTQGITYTYDLLANVAFSKKEWEKAETLFVETMKRVIAAGTAQDDDSVIEMSLKLAQIYAHLNEDNKAIDGFKFCVKSLNDKLGKAKEESDEIQNSKALLGIVHNIYAGHLMNKSKYIEALMQYKTALKLAFDIYGEEGNQVLILMNDVGSVYSLLNNHAEALEYIHKAVVIGNKTQSPDLPAFYCNMATIELRRGNVDVARKLCRSAIKIAKQRKDKLLLDEAEANMKEIESQSKR